MHPVTRIEIIADEVEMHKILESLDKVGIPGYTVIPNVLSKSTRGNASDDLAVTGLGNVYIMAHCPQELVKPLVEKIRPILNKFGGSCYLSEVMEIRSVKCVASL
jgi:nitrogen regulatory protein PII